ncbi:MAG: magnesium-translocating P-type ATPase [Firmicutes bacterium]|nr:magnesium-translocating P-type ATPase [Bacillota bacterium]
MVKTVSKNKAPVVCAGNEKLLEAAKADVSELPALYGNTLNGFNEEQVDEARSEYGKNIMAHRKKDSWFKRLFHAFVNPFTVVLFIMALIMVLTEIVFTGDEPADPMGTIIIMLMVTVSGITRFVQESRSGNAAERLKAMIKTTTCVQRVNEEGVTEKLEIPLEEVVVGDIIHLAAGDMLPADVRILSSKDLFVRESSLTGESLPVEKFSSALQFEHKNSIQLNNLAFTGSNVISGSAIALAIAIGGDTHLGSLATRLTLKKTKTNFEKGVASVSWLLIGFMAIMLPVVFLAVGIMQNAWLQALMFGLAVAVGLTPEMLPMIVTAGLAKGAVKLSKKKTIVKNLNSIQNFGAIDLLCTDKTGTLTEDEIVLEKYLDIHGKEDTRILRHALLNSHFQTGMKNLMDVAILKHLKDAGMDDLIQRYVKVDEIPFDFVRRRMSVVIQDATGKTQLITKGAIEEMLEVCSFAEYNGVVPLTEQVKREILKTVDKLNLEGMRVLGVAQKTNPAAVGEFSVKDESEMVLIGYLAFLDPPKESAKAAIRALHEHGVEVKVLTGDNVNVTVCIAGKVGLPSHKVLLGTDIEGMEEEELKKAVEETNIFAKLSPQQKVRVVAALRDNGHVVGFLGDGINDAAAIREADVGISVDTAVDIAKESADIILLEKDLMVLEQGIIEGRKTFANIIKYVKMTASSNFGNMFSVLFAVFFVPFLPMLPIQILMLNLIYDISCVSVPWDNVDPEYLKSPKSWDAKSIRNFMFWIGPTSSVFDITTYLVLFYWICPAAVGANGLPFNQLTTEQQTQFIMIFQGGWFIESLWSQTLVIHLLRTPKTPFVKSRASWPVIGLTSAGIALGTILPFLPYVSNEMLKMSMPSDNMLGAYFGILAATIVGYMLLTTLLKALYVKRYKELL